jgi:hypothetical protein
MGLVSECLSREADFQCELPRLVPQGGDCERLDTSATSRPPHRIEESGVLAHGSKHRTNFVHRQPATDRIGGGHAMSYESLQQRNCAGSNIEPTAAVNKTTHLETFPASSVVEHDGESRIEPSRALLDIDQSSGPEGESSCVEHAIEGTLSRRRHPVPVNLPQSTCVTEEPRLLVVRQVFPGRRQRVSGRPPRHPTAHVGRLGPPQLRS